MTASTTTKRTKLVGPARDLMRHALAAKYKAGASIRALADDTDRSYGFVHRMLDEAEQAGLCEIRSRGGSPKR